MLEFDMRAEQVYIVYLDKVGSTVIELFYL